MIAVVGIQFKKVGKVYYFDPEGYEFKRDQLVVVETSRGVECGRVLVPYKEVPDEEVVAPLRKVMRLATEEDIKKLEQNKIKEKEAFQVCQQKIREHNMEMKLIEAEYTFDGSKVLFYFTADGRVDFRDLVKDLATVFRMRIELRQIGVRDEAKTLGGLGICGRPLCCSTFLGEFDPVSIKMAKEQGLSLNPTKISGTCGRLMCCLKNEQNSYEDAVKRLPRVGDYVETPGGKGTVSEVNLLREKLKVKLEKGDESVVEAFLAEEVKVLKKPTPVKNQKEHAPKPREHKESEKSQKTLEK